jgi:hypothetical protein
MQEGIPIASFRFHQAMITIFEDFLDWMIVIIDNLLILAHDYHDLYNKIVLVVRRCIKHNVFLKFEKSNLSIFLVLNAPKAVSRLQMSASSNFSKFLVL